MSVVRIRLPNGSERDFPKAPSVLEVAQSIGSRLAAEAIGAKINASSSIVDVRSHLADGDQLEIITLDNPDGQEIIRHTAAHVMAEAVQELWPNVKVTIGPVIEHGFYYDFETQMPFTHEDLSLIESKMGEIILRNEKILKEEWPSSKAIDFFNQKNEKFKVEIIKDLNQPTVTIYSQGKWFDLCRGPHLQRTGQIKAFKVLSLAGAYWRGDETKARLQRVYGTAFSNKKELDLYLERLEESKKRDHRKLGKELELFYFHQEAPGSPFFTGKGTIIYNELQNYLRELYVKYGYQEVITPQIYDVELYHRSGHYENYRENMYFISIDQREFSVKPMNCPGHCLLYGFQKRSYRDLPFRVADFGRLHRHERSGVMHGLTRVRTFCQDDAHIFCGLDQLQDEIRGFMKLLDEVYQQLGMNNYKIFLSTRPEKRMGSDDLWNQAEEALGFALKSLELEYQINPGDGAFYGPKLDIMMVDAIGRSWQLGTLQCDFNMPEKFNLNYVGTDNSQHRPVMLHRAILGSLERFIGVYLEHCSGWLPLWLAPEQVRVINITSHQFEYAQRILETLKNQGVRVKLDDRNEKLSFKIREAQLEKIPYIVIIGDKEKEKYTLSLRLRGGETKQDISVDQFVKDLFKDIKNRKYSLDLFHD